MTATITAKLEGMDSLLATLRDLPTRVSNKLVKPAMQEAGSLLKDQLRWNAYQQLQGALARGYKDKDTTQLFRTAATRAKSYKKGETTFVAVGFNYEAGGHHAHLVELGHRIVTGGTIKQEDRVQAPITAAGRRWLAQHGMEPTGRRGKLSGWQFSDKMAWVSLGRPKKVLKLRDTAFGRRIRGGGKIGGMTDKFPMLAPAFDVMKRPMMLAIEWELKKIEPEAIRLAQEKGVKK